MKNSVELILDRIETKLKAMDRRVLLGKLRPGLEKFEVARLLTTHFRASDPLLESLYAWRNGTGDGPGKLGEIYLFPGFYFLSLEDALLNRLEFADSDLWSRDWFPFLADGGGDYYVVDLGVDSFGAVRHFQLEQTEQTIEFESISMLLETIAQGYEKGVFFLDGEYLEMDEDNFTELAASVNPDITWWRE